MRVVKKADQKLVIIPVLLILVRLPGTIRFLIVAANKMPEEPHSWTLILLYLQVQLPVSFTYSLLFISLVSESAVLRRF